MISGKLICKLIVIATIIVACEKDVAYETTLTGIWKWKSTEGGYSGIWETPESTGKNIIIEFTTDSIYREFLNGSLLRECHFQISEGIAIFNQDTVPLITGVYPWPLVFEIYNGTTLNLYDNCVDGFKYVYSRMK